MSKSIRYAFVLGLCASISAPMADKVMLVIGNSNGTTMAGGFAIGDRFIRDRLQNALGHSVQVVPDSADLDSLTRSAARSDLVIVLESVTSLKLLAKLKAVPQPILNFEAFIQDDLGFTAPGPSGDPGPPSQFEFGVLDKSDRIAIRDAAHPLAAGMTGQVTVYSQLKQLTWGKVAPAAEVVATLAADTSGACIYVYRKGSRLFDGTAAAGLRIGFFLEDDNVTGTPNLMTTEGLALFDRAVAFGLANGQSATTSAPGKRSDGVARGRGLSIVRKAISVDARGRRFTTVGTPERPLGLALDRLGPH
jgi:hypothetical protein